MKLINISENFHDHPFLSLLKAFPSKKNPSKYALGLFPFRSFFPEKIPRGTHSKMKKIFLSEKIYNGKGISKLI